MRAGGQRIARPPPRSSTQVCVAGGGPTQVCSRRRHQPRTETRRGAGGEPGILDVGLGASPQPRQVGSLRERPGRKCAAAPLGWVDPPAPGPPESPTARRTVYLSGPRSGGAARASARSGLRLSRKRGSAEPRRLPPEVGDEQDKAAPTAGSPACTLSAPVEATPLGNRRPPLPPLQPSLCAHPATRFRQPAPPTPLGRHHPLPNGKA